MRLFKQMRNLQVCAMILSLILPLVLLFTSLPVPLTKELPEPLHWWTTLFSNRFYAVIGLNLGLQASLLAVAFGRLRSPDWRSPYLRTAFQLGMLTISLSIILFVFIGLTPEPEAVFSLSSFAVSNLILTGLIGLMFLSLTSSFISCLIGIALL